MDREAEETTTQPSDAAPLEAWENRLEPAGPYHVRWADGTSVTYGTRGRPRAVNGLAKVLSPADIELVLHDELGKEIRVIAGMDVLAFQEPGGPGVVVIVRDSVEPDPGATVQTRG